MVGALLLALTHCPSLWAAVGEEGDGGPLLPCGTSGDFVIDQNQITKVFEFAKGVCAQRGESCPVGAPLPTSCGSAECQRAVQLAKDSCSSAFAKGGFLSAAFKPVLDAAVAVCTATPHPANAQVRSPHSSVRRASPLAAHHR